MARAFRRKKDRFVATLERVELVLLCSLIEQTDELLGSAEPAAPEPASADEVDPFETLTRGMEAALSGPGEDPALRRLLPEAHRDDPIAAADFRRRSGESVRRTKQERLQRTLGALAADDAHDGGDVELDLDRSQAADLLVCLTDVRLVLGERLGLRSDDDAAGLDQLLGDLAEDDPRVPLVLAYDFLTWMQEGMAIALIR